MTQAAVRYCPICAKGYGEDLSVCPADGGILVATASGPEALVGQLVRGRYRVLRVIGEGGMGEATDDPAAMNDERWA